jgi:hypothetical protein
MAGPAPMRAGLPALYHGSVLLSSAHSLRAMKIVTMTLRLSEERPVETACGVSCSQCRLFVPLRFLKSEEKFDCRQVLLTEQWPLVFLCRVCGALSEHSSSYKELAQRTIQAQLRDTKVIHRMTFRCEQDGCVAPIKTYIEVDKRQSRDEERREMLEWCFSLRRKISCPDKHPHTLLSPQSFLSEESVAEVSSS